MEFFPAEKLVMWGSGSPCTLMGKAAQAVLLGRAVGHQVAVPDLAASRASTPWAGPHGQFVILSVFYA